MYRKMVARTSLTFLRLLLLLFSLSITMVQRHNIVWAMVPEAGPDDGTLPAWLRHEEEQMERRYRGRSEADSKGPRGRDLGHAYFSHGLYEQAAPQYWQAVLFHTQTPTDLTYDVQEVFAQFLQCYKLLGKPVDGLAFVSLESYRRGQIQMGESFLRQALELDPHNEQALAVKYEFVDQKKKNQPKQKQQQKHQQQHPTSNSRTSLADSETSRDPEQGNQDAYVGKTPEELYEVGSEFFFKKDYESCADVFELSCQLSKELLGPSCANAVYCRTMILDWGFNGTQFEADMKRIAQLTRHEARQFRYHSQTLQQSYLDITSPTTKEEEKNGASGSTSLSSSVRNFSWQRATSVHPHMMLGYPLEQLALKRYVAESVAYMDEIMARAASGQETANGPSYQIPPLPDDVPFSTDPQPFLQERQNADSSSYRIRVGFVGAGFNSKAVLYLSHDMFRFFNTTKFQIHIFSFAAPDSPYFIQFGMRGVDWRQRVQSNVYQFHDMRRLLNNHVEAARYIRKQGIHILLDWDGYARQGERAQGLFALRSGPVQMLHQEYLGTSGALYVDYHFTDRVTTPVEQQAEQYFTEKLIFLPNHFFSKGHALQNEVTPPSYEYQPRPSSTTTKYRLGTGTPQENRCLSPNHVGPSQVSFVFCNWNKFLKNNPQTVRSWIRILREVPNSILCLLQNPESGTEYFRKFIHEAAGTTKKKKLNSTGNDNDDGNDDDENVWASFEPGDGEELNDRIHFLPWEKNPFDHQRRNFDFCNVMLDSYPYNGHTVAQDALYAGVPIVTRSDGIEMSSRVTTSANVVLGLDSVLNAYQGPQQYEELAIALATNQTLFHDTRHKLIHACLQTNPMHPYWDVPRYVKNFERGLERAWDLFLRGESPQHIFLDDDADDDNAAQQGTYEDEIKARPPIGTNPIVEIQV